VGLADWGAARRAAQGDDRPGGLAPAPGHLEVLRLAAKILSPEKILPSPPPGIDPLDDPQATAAVYAMVWTFLLLGLIPALLVKLAFREPLADYGVRLGDRRRTFRTMALLGPLFVLGGYIASRDPAVQSQYPLNPSAGSSPAMFAVHAFAYLLFYLGWEFHFRGFLQHGLRGSMGDTSAVLVAVMASCLAHLGKPASETYAAILGGLLWGILAFRTRSLASGLVQHFLLGISLDGSCAMDDRRQLPLFEEKGPC